MSELTQFYYDEQLLKYTIQFMAIFANMKVRVGKSETQEDRLINVPVALGSKDRVVASIKSANTQNKPLRLPMLSANVRNVIQAPQMRKGVGGQRRNTYLPTGGLFPDDIEVVHQRMPVPYKAMMELTIFASNMDQHNQILEQILMLFDPILQIQISDELFDWNKITTVELMDINYDTQYPSGVDRRIIQTSLSFEVPIHISAPADIRKDFIEDIYLRIGAISTASQNSYDIIADLDAQGIDYDLIFSLDDIDIGD